MNSKKLFLQAMTALGGAALALSLLPSGAKADMTSDDLLSPAPSNNPTESNTVNGTNLPVWTINEGEQITFPSSYLNVYSTDRENLSIRELNSRAINPNAPTAPVAVERTSSGETSLAPADNGTSGSEPMMMNNSQEGIYIPSGQGRTSGTPAGPSRDPLPTGGDKGGDKPSGATSERNTPAVSNTPGRTNTNNGTTIPEQVINENREINTPSERTNTRPSETRTNNRTNTRTNPGSTTAPNTTRTDSETQNLNITPEAPSGQAPATGNTGGPPQGTQGGSSSGRTPSMNQMK